MQCEAKKVVDLSEKKIFEPSILSCQQLKVLQMASYEKVTKLPAFPNCGLECCLMRHLTRSLLFRISVCCSRN